MNDKNIEKFDMTGPQKRFWSYKTINRFNTIISIKKSAFKFTMKVTK